MNLTIQKTIEYLNEKTNSDFIPNFPETIKCLTELMEVGYGLADFKTVIDKKWEQWKGTKYQMYIRPSTLFGKNFENYLNEPARNPKNNAIQQLHRAVQGAKQTDWKLDSKR